VLETALAQSELTSSYGASTVAAPRSYLAVIPASLPRHRCRPLPRGTAPA